MKKYSAVLLVCVIILACLFPGVVRAADPAQQETPTFSNKDLEKYSNPSDETPVPAAGRTIEKIATTGTGEQREKNYWCSKANEYRKKIDRARDEVQDVERLASRENGGEAFAESRLRKPTRKKYEKAKKRLREAERELQYIEDDAHRKDIPPGWLRCQFE